MRFRKRSRSKPDVTQHVFDTEPLIGWRIFHYHGPDSEDAMGLFEAAATAPENENPFEWALRSRLTGVGYPVSWLEGRPMVAECKSQGGHTAPYAGCLCGLWGKRSIRDTLADMKRYHTNVIARVAYWGHFIEHRDGFRAQYAYPQEIIVIVWWGAGQEYELEQYELAEKIGEQYGIPARVHKLKLLGRPRTKPTMQAKWEQERQRIRQMLLQGIPQGAPMPPPARAASGQFQAHGAQAFQNWLASALPAGTPGSQQQIPQPFHWPEHIVHPGTFWQAKLVNMMADPFENHASFKPFPPPMPG